MPIGKFDTEIERPGETVAEDLLGHRRSTVDQQKQSQHLRDRQRMHAGYNIAEGPQLDKCYDNVKTRSSARRRGTANLIGYGRVGACGSSWGTDR